MEKEDIIKKGRQAYTEYMYYECAESGYAIDEAFKWKTKYYEYVNMAIEAGIATRLLSDGA